MENVATIVTYFYSVLASLGQTPLSYPEPYTATGGEIFDYIIVGGGTAGCTLAGRLSEDPNVSVLLIEAGTTPTVASQTPGFFPFLPHSDEDWDYYSEDDGITSKALTWNKVPYTRGKVLGGSSSLNHIVYERSSQYDIDSWSNHGGDMWSYNTMLEYFKKSENNIDPRIMNGPTAKYHSNSGTMKVNEQTNQINYEETDAIILQMFEDIGISTIFDINVPRANGTAKISVTANEDGIRSSTAYEYLYNNNRSNLKWMEKTNVMKIIFKENVAVGVVVKTSNGKKKLFAMKEVIISAGTFNSAKLLLHSGVGPKYELQKFNIPVVSDLPVGSFMKDHISNALVTCGQKSTVYTKEDLAMSADLTTMPVSVICGSYSLKNSFPDMQVITLQFTPRSVLAKTVLCHDFGYSEDIVDKLINQCNEREIFVTLVVSTKHKSYGKVTLHSKDPNDPPKIYTGFFSDESDLSYMVENLKLVYKLQNSSYIQEVGGFNSMPVLPSCDSCEIGSDKYWRSYAKDFATTTMHPLCTNAMGLVVNGELKVKGVKRLRVVDESIIPCDTSSMPSAKTCATTIAIAEKAADMIKADNFK